MKNKPFIPVILATLFLLGPCQRSGTRLFNGKDFKGWKFVLSDSTVIPEDIWSIRDGVIHCKGTTNGYMRTTEKYSDYTLTLEWRWTEKEGNSGVLLNTQLPDKVWPHCIECQLESGNAGDIILVGPGSLTRTDNTYMCDSMYTFVRKYAAPSEKPTGMEYLRDHVQL